MRVVLFIGLSMLHFQLLRPGASVDLVAGRLCLARLCPFYCPGLLSRYLVCGAP